MDAELRPAFLTVAPQALNQAGVMLSQMRRAGALGLLLAFASCVPRGPEALRRGDEALAANRPAEAIPLLERAVTDLPTDPSAWNHLGLAYQEVGRPDEARKAYLRALQFDRNFFDVYFNLGSLEFEAGRWGEAERALRTYLGVETHRTNKVAWRMLGDAQLASNQLDAAERTFATALQLAPSDPATRNSLGLTLARKRRWRDAQSQFAQVARALPDAAEPRLNLAIVTQQLGDRRGALDQYKAFLALNPPPASVDAVRAQVQQLEALLGPTPTVSTNAVATRTTTPPAATRPNTPTNSPVATTPRTAPPVIATNPPPPTKVVAAAETPPRTNPSPAPTPIPQTKPAETALPPTPPAPQLEIVKVEDAPTLLPARDPLPAPASASPRADTRSAAPPVQPQATAVGTNRPPAQPEPATVASETSAESRRTFWQRVNPTTWGNPVKWFRGSEKSGTNAAPANPPPTPPPATRVASTSVKTTLPVPPPQTNNPAPAVRSKPPVERTAPPKPTIPRYVHGKVPALTPGNRAAAEAALASTSADPWKAAQRAVELDPSWPAAWQALGRLALDSKNTGTALSAGEAVVTLEPSSPAAHQLFAAALLRAGYPADAAFELEQAVDLAPTNAATHLALAGIYARDLAEPDLARPHYEQVLALDPQHPQAAAIRVWLANNP